MRPRGSPGRTSEVVSYSTCKKREREGGELLRVRGKYDLNTITRLV